MTEERLKEIEALCSYSIGLNESELALQVPTLIAEVRRLQGMNTFLTNAMNSRKNVDETWIDINLENDRLRALLKEALPVVIDMQKYIGRGFLGNILELGKRLEHVRATIDAALSDKFSEGEKK